MKLQTGSILFEGKHLTHWDYCLNPVASEDDDQSEQLDLKAFVCKGTNSEQRVALAGKYNVFYLPPYFGNQILAKLKPYFFPQKNV